MFNRSTFFEEDFNKKLNINLSKRVKFLGTYIDSQLTFCDHIDHVCAKLNSAYYAILSLKNTPDTEGLLSVYYSLAFSHMSYNVVSWGNAGEHSNRIFINQKRILRLIFNLEFRQTCKDLFIRNKILTFPCIYIQRCLLYVNNNRSMFARLGCSNNYRTRGIDILQIPQHRTTFFKRSPLYNCIKLYNGLPIDLRVLSGKKIVVKLKSFLLAGGFYSVRDYLLSNT